MLIKRIMGGYAPEDAEAILHNTDSSIQVVRVEEVYYPYKMICYDVEIGKGRKKNFFKKSDCIIDLVRGSAAIGEGVPVYEEKEIDESSALEIKIPDEEVHRKGHDFVLKLFLNKAKLLRVPSITVTDETLFYKNFFIVHCKDEAEMDYFIMIDSMDGAISILDYKGS